MKTVTLWTIFLLGMPFLLNSQVFLDAGTTGEYNTHPFLYRGDSADFTVNPHLSLFWENEHWSIGYEANILVHESVSERNMQYHRMTVDGFTDRLGFQVFYEWSRNSDLYRYYHYRMFGALGKMVGTVAGINYQISPSVVWASYPELSQFDYNKIEMSGRISKKVAAKTTLIVQASLYYKKYLKTVTMMDTIAQDQVMLRTASGGYGSGGGRQGGGWWSPGSGTGGSGVVYYQQVGFPTVSKATAMVRLARSIHPNIGLALYGFGGVIIDGNSRLLSGPGAEISQLDIFDLSSAYEETGAGTELTAVLPWLIVMKTGIQHQERSFLTEGIFLTDTTYTEDILRKDKQQRIWMQFSVSFYPERSFLNQLDCYLAGELILNRSNSYWYEFDQKSIMVGLTLGF